MKITRHQGQLTDIRVGDVDLMELNKAEQLRVISKVMNKITETTIANPSLLLEAMDLLDYDEYDCIGDPGEYGTITTTTTWKI